MPKQAFEERLARQLSTYAESGVRPFDPHAVARATISSQPGWGHLPRPMLWQGSTARSLRLALALSLMLALLLVAILASSALLPGGAAAVEQWALRLGQWRGYVHRRGWRARHTVGSLSKGRRLSSPCGELRRGSPRRLRRGPS